MNIYIPVALLTWSINLSIFAAGFVAGYFVCYVIQGMLFNSAMAKAFGWR